MQTKDIEQTETKIELSFNSTQLADYVNDSSFTFVNSNLAKGKVLKLNALTYTNLLANFPGRFSDFSILTSDVGYISISIPYFMPSASQGPNFINYINQQLNIAGSVLILVDRSGYSANPILNANSQLLAFQSNNPLIQFRLQGQGYRKLGFLESNVAFQQYNVTVVSDYIPNWAQTNKIYIQFSNYDPAILGFVNATFSINNTSAFGGTISLQLPSVDQVTYCQISSNSIRIERIFVKLFDEWGQSLETVEGNQNRPSLTMNLSIYDEI